MDNQAHEELIHALRDDVALRQQLAGAETAEEFESIAAAAGYDVQAADFMAVDGRELSDADLESVSGGYTFPPTDWIYCDNPWTNVWCTLKCG